MQVKTVDTDREANELLSSGWQLMQVTGAGWHLVLPEEGEETDEQEAIVSFLRNIDAAELDRMALQMMDYGSSGTETILQCLIAMASGQIETGVA